MNFTINPETNRPVRIGGPTYNKLVLKYYIDDAGNILNQRKLTDDIFSYYNIKKFKPENEHRHSTNKYTIKTAGDDYIGNNTGTGENGLQSSKEITTDFESTIEYNTTTKFVDIKKDSLSFKFNDTSDQMRFRFYKTSSNISLSSTKGSERFPFLSLFK